MCTTGRRSRRRPGFSSSDAGYVDVSSIPLSFLLGYLGTIWGGEKPDTDKFAEMEVRSLTGVGVEPAAIR